LEQRRTDRADQIRHRRSRAAKRRSGGDVVGYLLEKGANVNAHDGGGWTPLDYAASSNDAAIAALLIDHGAGVNAVENGGKTALQIAHEDHASSVERMLRQRGAKE